MTDMEKPHTVRGVDEIWLNLWRVYGVDRGALIWSSLSSAYDRLLFAYHHLKLLRKATVPAVEQELEALGFLESLDEKDTEALFSQSMHQVKMHVTDCIQHMHAVGDTVAFAIYFSIEIPEDKQLKKRDITLYTVRKLLEENPALPDTVYFLELLKRLANSSDYVYLADLNNHAKHRSIVKPAVDLGRELPREDQKELLIFPQVEMRNPPASLQNRGATPVHEQRSILPFIETELARIWGIYGEIRQQIEKQVRLAPSKSASAVAPEA